jgi:predicted AlkP superfamily phosphohydrolase/phosphomutase
VNPGKHGVFGFAGYSPGSYVPTLANATSVRSARLWDVLGHYGRRVVVLNVPFTYPPAPVDGVLVSGMLTPSPESEYTYPPDLKRQLLARLDDYTGYMEKGGLENGREALIQHVHSNTEQQRQAALYLIREFPWDFFIVVFTGPDRLQHYLWAEIDSSHPLHNADAAGLVGTAILDHYRFLDQTIADIVGDLGEETIVLILSDHGFNGCYGRFYVNAWLQAQGLLAWHKEAPRVARLLSIYTQSGVAPLFRRLRQALFPKSEIHFSRSLRWATLAKMVDWSRTRAYFSLDGGIRINLRGREPRGIVAQGSEYQALRCRLQEDLQSVTDPDTGQPVLDRVFFREELYHGPFVSLAPDLVLEPRRDSRDARHNYILDGSFPPVSQDPFGISNPYTGNHTLDGIFCAWGKGIRQGDRVEGARIIDLAPTVLYAMGLPIPREMDGQVLMSIFDRDLLADEPRYDDTTLVQCGPAQGFNEAEHEIVERRLRDLGYLG